MNQKRRKEKKRKEKQKEILTGRIQILRIPVCGFWVLKPQKDGRFEFRVNAPIAAAVYADPRRPGMNGR